MGVERLSLKFKIIRQSFVDTDEIHAVRIAGYNRGYQIFMSSETLTAIHRASDEWYDTLVDHLMNMLIKAGVMHWERLEFISAGYDDPATDRRSFFVGEPWNKPNP